MGWLGVVFSVVLILVVLSDAFVTILLPRRVSRKIRLTRLYYHLTWPLWRRVALSFRLPKRRFALLSYFAPLSLPVLFGAWAVGLILGFATLHTSLGTTMNGMREGGTFEEYFYFSGVTFLTLGYGDVSPQEPMGRALAVLEAGVGFGFLAIVIGYVPVIYSGFSRREIAISLLDARAGSPPTAAQLLIRIGSIAEHDVLIDYFDEWEVWCAEVLESHLSFPILAFFRSQHDNESWLAALTMMLDTTAIVLAGMPSLCPYQARLTFAIARHTAVDLAQTLLRTPILNRPNRLDDENVKRLVSALADSGIPVVNQAEFADRLAELRSLYEPFVQALSEYCLLDLPPFLTDTPVVDNWQTSAWMRRTQKLGDLAAGLPADDHND